MLLSDTPIAVLISGIHLLISTPIDWAQEALAEQQAALEEELSETRAQLGAHLEAPPRAPAPPRPRAPVPAGPAEPETDRIIL